MPVGKLSKNICLVWQIADFYLIYFKFFTGVWDNGDEADDWAAAEAIYSGGFNSSSYAEHGCASEWKWNDFENQRKSHKIK